MSHRVWYTAGTRETQNRAEIPGEGKEEEKRWKEGFGGKRERARERTVYERGLLGASPLSVARQRDWRLEAAFWKDFFVWEEKVRTKLMKENERGVV